MKADQRYQYALLFCRKNLPEDADVNQKTELILEASSRFKLSPPQTRNLVSQLRKDRA